MKTTVTNIASRLKSVGIEVKSVTEPDDLVDGAVNITDALHIQVGEDYAHVVEEDDEGLFHFQESKTIDALIDLVRKRLGEQNESSGSL